MKLIEAKKAREISEAANANGSVSHYSLIEDAMTMGLFHIYLQYPMSIVTKYYLVKEGYRIEDMGEQEIENKGNYHKISW